MTSPPEQPRQRQWTDQWTLFADHERSLFEDWIYPNRLEDLTGKAALDCGCGGGQHVEFCAPFARMVVGVDLNTAAIARGRNRLLANAYFIQSDLATLVLRMRFDVVYCIGVIHHTADPDATFQNLKRLCKPGGRLILWCYSSEGNTLLRWFLGPLQFIISRPLGARQLKVVSWFLTIVMMLAAQTVYRLPIRQLPYYEYLCAMRRLRFSRVVLNVFDKLNAPITHFISHAQVVAWFNPREFTDIHVSAYRGVSWRASGTLRQPQGPTERAI